MNYKQPSEYHFSHDSVFFAKKIFDESQTFDFLNYEAIDIGSGSGIIGLDYLFHCRQSDSAMPTKFDFLEIQKLYEPFFEENVKSFGHIRTKINFLNLNYDVLQKNEYHHKYHLVVSNPPYFFKENGKLSPSDFKNRCRFFIDSDLQQLIKSIVNCLHPKGNAYLLIRNQTQHGIDIIQKVKQIVIDQNTALNMELMPDIRSTYLVKITYQNDKKVNN